MDQSTATRLAPSGSAAVPRPNLYAAVHKGLRACMSEALVATGSADASDPRELFVALQKVRSLLELCDEHLATENRFIHTAMERARPRSSQRTCEDHDEHLEAIPALRAAADAVEHCESGARAAALATLYARLSAFVAHNLEHMHVEETDNMEVLWAHYDDNELAELHNQIVASIPPPEMAHFLRWIIPAVSHAERVAMFTGMRATAPREAFESSLAIARDRLTMPAWSRLATTLGVPAAPAEQC